VAAPSFLEPKSPSLLNNRRLKLTIAASFSLDATPWAASSRLSNKEKGIPRHCSCAEINSYTIVDKETDIEYPLFMSNKTHADPVSDLKAHIGFWMRFVSNHVSYSFARMVQETGVTVAEWVVLREMYGRDQTTPSAIAEATGMTRGAASKLVDRLVEKKLVSRRERADDRRFQDIALTPAGTKLVPALAALADQNDHVFFSVLTAAERASLLAVLKKLVQRHDLHTLPTE
jgi:DNA-binding MarR family transcriptional regulator